MLDGQGYFKKDGSMGYYRLIIEKNIHRNKIEKSLIDRKDDYQLYILINRFKILDDDKKIIFDSGDYFKIYSFQSNKDDKFPDFYRNMLRIYSIHSICFGEAIPFYFQGKWSNHITHLPPYVSFNSLSMTDIVNRWSNMLNDVVVLDKVIPFESVLEKALTWYTLGLISATHLEGFMCFYRSIETFANNFVNKYKTDFDKYIENELPMFKLNKKFFSDQLYKKNVSSFLRMKPYDEGLIEKIKELRDRIVHGHEIELEFNSNVIETKTKMKEISYNLICRKIKNMKIKELKNNDFQRDYHLYINTETGKIKIYEQDDINYNQLGRPLILKQFGSWTKGDIEKILKLKDIDNEIKNDIKYYLKLQKQGKYKGSGSVFRQK